MQLNKKIVIAVDGHSSCGKSTFAKQIAMKLDYIYIDSGAMYRAVACYAIQNKIADGKNINTALLKDALPKIDIFLKRNSVGQLETYLNDENIETEIRGVAVSELVSEVSKIKEVRSFLVAQQQKMGQNKGIVMDGRDIGTVVFPNAEIKLFMTASTKVRAQRRYDELIEKGVTVTFEEIEQNVIERDHNDTTRAESPLIQAVDAEVLDNSEMTVENQMDWFTDLLTKKQLLN